MTFFNLIILFFYLIKKPVVVTSVTNVDMNTHTEAHPEIDTSSQLKLQPQSQRHIHEEHVDSEDSLATSYTINVTEPKPVSNTLSSLASSMINKEKDKNFSEDSSKEEKEDKGDNIDKNDKKSKNEKSKEVSEITEITEVDLEIKDDEKIKIKKPNDIYYEIYKAAKEKARTARKLAFDAYLEVKKIKNTYMLDDSDSDTDFNSDSDSESSSGTDSGSGSDYESETGSYNDN